MKPRPVYLDAADVPRLARATRETLGRPRAEVKAPAPTAILSPIRVMQITQQVQAGSASGPGKGKGRFCAVTFAEDDTATYGAPDGDEFPVYTIDTASPTTVGKKVIVGTLAGRAVILVEVCT